MNTKVRVAKLSTAHELKRLDNLCELTSARLLLSRARHQRSSVASEQQR